MPGGISEKTFKTPLKARRVHTLPLNDDRKAKKLIHGEEKNGRSCLSRCGEVERDEIPVAIGCD